MQHCEVQVLVAVSASCSYAVSKSGIDLNTGVVITVLWFAISPLVFVLTSGCASAQDLKLR